VFDYRYHALSLAAVLLALAVGIVIGVAIGDSNLVSSAKSGIVHDLSSEVGAAQRQTGQLRAQLSSEEAFANDLYPIAVHGLLRERSIGLLFLGDASDQIDGLVRSAVSQAGGNVVTVVAVREPVDLAGRVLAGLDRAVVLNGRVLPVGASIGIASLRPATSPGWRVTPRARAMPGSANQPRAAAKARCSNGLGHSPEGSSSAAGRRSAASC